TVARLLRLSLHRVGIGVETTDDAEQALRRLDEVHPSVLVIDDAAGEGWELIRSVRSLPGRAHLPALLLTAGEDRTGWFGRMRRPKAETMPMPFDEFQLQRTVSRLAGRPLT
ncbi:MAG: hypothetical protein WD336_03425, partial [Trueperaceae bacterium]